MPVLPCRVSGQSGFKFGESGSCFIGPDAEERAEAVGRAIAREERRQRQGQEVAQVVAPDAIEADYQVTIERRINALHPVLFAAALAALRRSGLSDTEPIPNVEIASNAVRGAASKWTAANPTSRITPEVEEIAEDVDMFTSRGIAASVGAVVVGGLLAASIAQMRAEAGGLTPMHTAWVKENVKLIGGLEKRHVADLVKVITETVEKGGTVEGLAVDLEKRLGVSQRRAKLIARNEVGNLNAQVTQARQEELAITQFVWVTMRDDRVREEHAEIDGQVFDWATGAPGVGLPGQPINCRCVGEAVLP